MIRTLFLSLLLASTCRLCAAVAAQVSDSATTAKDELIQVAERAIGQHEVVDDAELAAARAELRLRVSALERALGVDPELASTWKTYLLWDALTPHLDDDHHVDRQSLHDLNRVLKRFRSNQPGLELPVFLDVAESLASFQPKLAWAMTAKARDAGVVYDGLLRSMTRQLKRHIENPTEETQWQIARVVEIVDQLGDSPALVDAIRREYRQPNTFVTASAALVNRAAQRPVQTTQPVRDCILGTSIFGCADTEGTVQFQLCPSAECIDMVAVLTGSAASRTVGYNGPVKIGATGTTTFFATKRLLLSHEAFLVVPAGVSADTRTQIHSIKKMGGPLGRRLIERIAKKRAAENKRKSERIAASHAEDRIAGNFDQDVNQAASNGRYQFEAKVVDPLMRRAFWPDYLQMHSAGDALGVDATVAAAGQLAANGPPPDYQGACDLAFRLHESAIGNYFPLALGGVVIQQDQADVPASLRGEAPTWLKKAASQPLPKTSEEEQESTVLEPVPDNPEVEHQFTPWSITLNEQAPVSVTFDDDTLRIRIRATRLASDEREYRNWDFVLKYNVARRGNQIILRRTGNIEVFPSGFDPKWDKKMPAAKASFRRTLAKNMNARAERGESFPPEIVIPPIQLPRIGELTLQQVTSDDGWLTVRWTL